MCDVSAGTNIIKCVLLRTLPPVTCQAFVYVRWYSEGSGDSTCLDVGGKCFICVSTNNGLQLATHPPHSSAHSPLSRKKQTKLKVTLSLLSSASSRFLPFVFSSVRPALLRLSVLPRSRQKNQCRTSSTLRDSAHVFY